MGGRRIMTFSGTRRLEVARYVAEKGGVECFRLMQHGDETLVFLEDGDEKTKEIREEPGFQRSLIAYLKSEEVPIESYWTKLRQILRLIWYRPILVWRFLRNQDPPR